MTRVRWALLLGLLTAPGCASAPRGPNVAGPPSGSDCRDVQYRGLFKAPDQAPGGQRFRMSARACGGDEAVLEFRGLVGGPALIAGVRVGHDVRLILPGRRVVAEGPDEQRFWKQWTGAPLDGALIRSLAEAPLDGELTVDGWSVRVATRRGERFPETVSAVNEAGERFELKKTSDRPAAGPVEFPPVPSGAEWRLVREAAPRPTAPVRDE